MRQKLAMVAAAAAGLVLLAAAMLQVFARSFPAPRSPEVQLDRERHGESHR